jgi:two-component system, NtrC family, sensor kinase
MSPTTEPSHARILVIDDNPSIHDDFRKILAPVNHGRAALDEAEALLFSDDTETAAMAEMKPFEIHSAFQGQEGLQMVVQAQEEGRPYSLAFVDVRMPPGWDGVETIARIWEKCADLQVVICTAYSDYSWKDIFKIFGRSDNLLILKKPFDNAEVLQLAHALTHKWALRNEVRVRLHDLDRLVQERTAALTEANARLQAEMAQRAAAQEALAHSQKMEGIGQLAAGVAHDFNNLLTVIQGHASLQLSNVELPDETLESLREINTAAERAAGLTRQLLAFSRRQVTQAKEVQIVDLMLRMEKMLLRLVGEDIEFRCVCPPHLPLVLADETGIEQILVNLVVNARDATPGGGRIVMQAAEVVLDAVEIARSRPEARPGPFVCLSVSDNGCGIAQDVLPRIFEPFFTTKGVGKGTGLGLSTVYAAARQHHGWIEVQSAVGEGTTFRVYLPQLVTPARKDEAAGANGGATPDRREAGREAILLVEDEAALRQLACQALKANGYQVFPAEDARTALRLWEERAGGFDLLLTDMVLPGGLTGLDLARRCLDARPDLCILLSSGYSAELARSEATVFDQMEYLPKPYDLQKLLNAVRRCLHRGGTSRPPKNREAVVSFL